MRAFEKYYANPPNKKIEKCTLIKKKIQQINNKMQYYRKITAKKIVKIKVPLKLAIHPRLQKSRYSRFFKIKDVMAINEPIIRIALLSLNAYFIESSI